MSAPETDRGNPYVIRYNKAEDTHYLASEKDGKKTKWTAYIIMVNGIRILKASGFKGIN